MLQRGCAARAGTRTMRAFRMRAASTITKAGEASKPEGSAAFGGIHLGGGEASEGSFFYRHLVPFGMWTAVSLNVAAFFSSGDEGVQILLHLADFAEPILAPGTPKDRLTERLERVVQWRCAPLDIPLRPRPPLLALRPSLIIFRRSAGSRCATQRLAEARACRDPKPDPTPARHRGRHRTGRSTHRTQSCRQNHRVRLRLAGRRAPCA